MSHLRPDRWRPAHLLHADVTTLTWLVLVLALIRGLDYSTGQDASPPTGAPPPALVGIENAFPLVAWGALILLGVAILGIGVLGRWHQVVWVGHATLAALYTGLLVGLTVGYLDRPYLDGIRSATGLALPVALHLLFLWRMGPRPTTSGSRHDAEPA